MFNLDYHVFQMINHFAVSDAFLNPLMDFLSQDGEYLFFLGIIIYWLMRTKSNRRMVAEGLIAACVALGLNGVIGFLVYRDRPFVHHHVVQLIQHVANASFPSDHATGAFVIATSIWIWRKRDGWIWLLLAAGIAFSRVWTGVHYPTDVLAGMVIGILIAFMIHVLMNRWKLADNILNGLVQFYEKLESKVWKNKNTSHS
jgi:undecaprenyl-diphosphatase